jgi:hypothetical protein
LTSSLDVTEKINEISGLLQTIVNEFNVIYNNDLKISSLQR